MSNKDALDKKNKSLKLAIERCNEYKAFVDKYVSTKSLDDYITHLKGTFSTLSNSTIEYYERLFYAYENGHPDSLLINLYDKLLAADEYKRQVTEELKSLLREL